MEYKKGQAWLTKKVINIIIAIACILLLIVVPGKIYAVIFGSQDKEIAIGTADDISQEFESLGENSQQEYLLLAPDGWLLVPFSADNARKPNQCDGACVCICPGKTFGGYNCDKGTCKSLSKDIKSDKESINIPYSIILKSTKDYFTVSMKEEIKPETKRIEQKPEISDPSIEVSIAYSLLSIERPSDAAVDRIVLHHTGGSNFIGAYEALKTNGFSVHYIIDRDGKIYYLVDEKREAFHAGNADYNARSIGIEIVNTGLPDMKYTEAQYNSINSLIRDIAKRNSGIKIDNEHVIGHFEIKNTEGYCRKPDPSPNFEWAKIGLPEHITADQECPLLVKEYGFALAVV